MLFTNRTMREGGHAAAVEAALGDRLAARFDRIQPHVPDFQLAEALDEALKKEVGAVIALGGGSAIGMAKAVAYSLEEKRTGRPAASQFPTDQPQIPLAAIPTTYAGSEMTATFGITHTRQTPPQKIVIGDPKIAPRLVIYDAELTLNLSPEMTASTGINALAHGIEALYSVTRYPLSSAAAAGAIRHLSHALLRCYPPGDDLAARTEMLLGAHLAGSSLANVKMGLHHGLCHVLGGTAGVPHGIANAIILPHAVRFNADAVASLLLPAARAMGIAADSLRPVERIELLAQKISDLVCRMDLPQRLRDAGVKQDDLSRIARLAFDNRTVQSNPRPITDPAQIEKLLNESW
jgi:alcohol dehydrogenase